MRVCVFVDGENLRFAIKDLFTQEQFDRRDHLPKTAKWGSLFDYLVGLATDGKGERLRAYWYVVNYVDPYPNPVRRSQRSQANLNTWARRNKALLDRHMDLDDLDPEDRITKLQELQDTLRDKRNMIKSRFDGFQTIQNGIANHHRSIEFRRSGGIGYNLFTGEFRLEKTVDVNLAVDLVMLRDSYDLALIVSGDQDYVPAVQSIKDSGKQVVNVGFLTRSGKLLPGGAARLNQITDWSVSVPYEDMREKLNIPEPGVRRPRMSRG